MLERVGKETMDFIVEETGMEVDKGNNGEGDQQTEEEQFEEASFDRCFYIYGGPDQLEVTLCFPKDIICFVCNMPLFLLLVGCSLFFLCNRSWKHYQATMHYCLIGKRENLILSRKHYMMESLKKYNRFLVLAPMLTKMDQNLTKGRRLNRLTLMLMLR